MDATNYNGYEEPINNYQEFKRNGVFCSFGFGGKLITPLFIMKKKIKMQEMNPEVPVAYSDTAAVENAGFGGEYAQGYEGYQNGEDPIGNGLNDEVGVEANMKVDYVLSDNIENEEPEAPVTSADTIITESNINNNLNGVEEYAVKENQQNDLIESTEELYTSSLCMINIADLFTVRDNISDSKEAHAPDQSNGQLNDNDESKSIEKKELFMFPPLLSSMSASFQGLEKPDVVCNWIESELLYNNKIGNIDIDFDDSILNDGDIPNSTKLLWKTISCMIKANAPLYFSSELRQKSIGKSSSLISVSPESFEGRVLSLLAKSDSFTNTQAKEIEKSVSKMKLAENFYTPNTLIELETFLAKGELDKALNLAVDNELWPIAIVIANHISVSTYRKVVSAYTAKMFSSSSSTFRTLQLLSGSGSELVSDNPSLSSDNLANSWKQTLTSIISNGIPDTTEVLEVLGDKIWRDTGSVSAAHICYMLAGHSILEFGSEARIFLLGSDHISLDSRQFFVSPASIRRSECFLYALSLAGEQLMNQQAQNQGQPLDDASSSFLMFLSSKIESFQPFRLVYAMWLADLGYIQHARTWLNSILASSPDMSDAFGRQLEIFEDRLRKCCEVQDDQAPIYWTLRDPGLENEMSFHNNMGNGYYEQPDFFTDSNNIANTPYHAPDENNAHNYIGNMRGEIPVFDTALTEYPNGNQDMFQPVGNEVNDADGGVGTQWIDSTSSTMFQETPMENNFSSSPTGHTVDEISNKDRSFTDDPTHATNSDRSSVASTTTTSTTTNNPETRPQQDATSNPANQQTNTAEKVSKSNNSSSSGMSLSLRDPFGGIKGWLVQKIYGIPKDAHIANIGGKLEAYYDKEKKRWIFPGEDPNAASSAPPPPPMAKTDDPKPAATQTNDTVANDGVIPAPALNPTALPPAGNPFARGNASAKSRYVDPFSR